MLKKIIGITLIIAVLYFVIIFILVNIVYPRKYKEEVERLCSIYSVDPYLVYAIMKQESEFDENAKSHKGAIGLMQILPSTAKEVAENTNSIDEDNFNLEDAETNLEIGIKYMETLIKRYDGNVYIALAAYNAGMGNVDKWFNKELSSYDTCEKILENIKFNETYIYVSNVIKYYNMYKRIYYL